MRKAAAVVFFFGMLIVSTGMAMAQVSRPVAVIGQESKEISYACPVLGDEFSQQVRDLANDAAKVCAETADERAAALKNFDAAKKALEVAIAKTDGSEYELWQAKHNYIVATGKVLHANSALNSAITKVLFKHLDQADAGEDGKKNANTDLLYSAWQSRLIAEVKLPAFDEALVNRAVKELGRRSAAEIAAYDRLLEEGLKSLRSLPNPPR